MSPCMTSATPPLPTYPRSLTYLEYLDLLANVGDYADAPGGTGVEESINPRSAWRVLISSAIRSS